MESEKLIQELIEISRSILNETESLKKLNSQQLNKKPDSKDWCILECIEHLNRYSAFYNPQIESKIQVNSSLPEPEFESTWLGNYFAESMLPKENMKKMKTFKVMNPINAKLDVSVIDTFIAHQLRFIELLTESRKISLNKTKISTSISSLIRLRLGDAFRFIVNHNLRHMKQIERLKLQG